MNISLKQLYTNRLINENSPYLLLHAHNPVDWHPWGDEAFKKAKNEDKLLIISIGYATCHWCHVMEKESFSEENVAKTMNEHYIAIKVDREERPDIDLVYMDVAQLITGSGGWPLNVIALPDGRPVFAGTYFPTDNWLNVLTFFTGLYKEKRDEVLKQADNIKVNLNSLHLNFINSNQHADSDDKIPEGTFYNILNQIDFKYGGQNRTPKFPMPVVFEFLLFYYYSTKNIKAFDAVNNSLTKMTMGGIYDQIGGGFARYSIDRYWKVPHFEKMLYDNAQLVSLYSQAYRLTKNELYKKVVFETLDFMEDELQSPRGIFFSAVDADSEGVEGLYYTWEYDEIAWIAGSYTELITDYFSVSKNGNWEQGKNILYRSETEDEFQEKYGLSGIEHEKLIQNIKKNLLFERKKRKRPLTDDKVICSWNALTLKAYTEAYKSFGNMRFIHSANKIATFISNELVDESSRISRNYKNEKTYGMGFLDDYALTIEAFISLYQVTFDEQWLNKATEMTNYVRDHFYDKESGMFYYTSENDDPLIVRKIEIVDNVISSGNSVMAANLYKLGIYFNNGDFFNQAVNMLKRIKHNLSGNAWYFANWAKLSCFSMSHPFEIAIVGNNFLEINKRLNRNFIPDLLVSGCKRDSRLPLLENKYVENQTTIYVCRNKTCQLPVTNLEDALNQLNIR